MKIIGLDTETTGLDPVRNDIWQLAYIFVDNGKEIYRNLIECQPYSPWTADPEALEVGITSQGTPVSQTGYDKFMKPWHALDRFKMDLCRFINPYDKADKAAICGYNVIFDLNMLSWWFKKSLDKYGLGSYTDYTILDGAPMMRMMKHLHYITIENVKLSTVCKYYDITIDKAHNALSDAEAAMNVFPCIINDYKKMLNEPHYFGQLTEGNPYE